MKKLLLVAAFSAITATPVLADETYYVYNDSVGNCDVALSTGQDFPGMKVISKSSYSSEEAARQAVGGMDQCKDSAKPY